LRAQARLCARKSLPRKPKNTKTEHKQEKPNSNNLACSEHKQNYTTLGKHA